MGDVSRWQEKDDLDLTAGDVEAMLDAGLPVEVRHETHLPSFAVLVTTAATYGSPNTSFDRHRVTSGRVQTAHQYA
jgi:hypothetical protein